MKMNIDDIKKKFIAFHEQKGYLQRLDPNHPMDFFVGINEKGNDELVLLTTIEPAQLKSSTALEVEKNVRKDGRWATQIASVEPKNQDIFASLCLDLVASSYNVESEKRGLECVIKRFLAWQRLFANLKNDLSMSVLKGMVGELSFLTYIADKTGSWNEALNGWQGPDGADRDFVFQTNWFEIKSISTGKDKITISSLNQLEENNSGYLVVYNVDETSYTDPYAVTVNGMVDNIRAILEELPVELQLFNQKLVSLGYIPKQSYDSIFFSQRGMDLYHVDYDFPKLTTANVPSEIVAARYDISLAGIEKWKRTEEEVWN